MRTQRLTSQSFSLLPLHGNWQDASTDVFGRLGSSIVNGLLLTSLIDRHDVRVSRSVRARAHLLVMGGFFAATVWQLTGTVSVRYQNRQLKTTSSYRAIVMDCVSWIDSMCGSPAAYELVLTS